MTRDTDSPIACGSPVLLFDGVCNLCNSWVRFVLRRERQPTLRFASLQSEIGRKLLTSRGLDPESMDSLVLIEPGCTLTRSDAVLRIVEDLRPPWSALRVLRIVPGPIRDLVYRLVARQRYAIFGKRDACPIPPPEIRDRFLDLDSALSVQLST